MRLTPSQIGTPQLPMIREYPSIYAVRIPSKFYANRQLHVVRPRGDLRPLTRKEYDFLTQSHVPEGRACVLVCGEGNHKREFLCAWKMEYLYGNWPL